MSHIKKQLLEHLIRECVREVIEQNAKATLPPTTPPVTPSVTPPPSDLTLLDDPAKTTPLPQAFGDLGIYFVDPRNKSRIQKVELDFSNDYNLERNLYRMIAPFSGHRATVELGTLRALKAAIRNRNITLYLYLINKEGHKVLKHSKSLRDAQRDSMTAGSLFSKMLPPERIFEPITATSQRQASQIGTDVNEENTKLSRDIIIQMINDAGKTQEFIRLYGNTPEDYFDMYANKEPEIWTWVMNDLNLHGNPRLGEDETIGAPAPPADGLGTADQPPLPYEPKKIQELKKVIKNLIREAFSE